MLVSICTLLLASISILLIIPSFTLFVECLAAVLPRSKRIEFREGATYRPRLAIVVPAHNEAAGLASTLSALRAQMQASDRLVVVADNCTDDTAHVAKKYTDCVIERFDAHNKGKGFALRAAFEYLRSEPPEVIVFIDADCAPQAGFINNLASSAFASQCPVQATNLATSGAKDVLSSFAFTVKNLVRPLGLKRLGLPCLLTGTGMAMPSDLAFILAPKGDSIVEDMQMSVDAVTIGRSPRYCPQAVVVSPLPAQRAAARSQRTRWEHGHLLVLTTQTPRLLLAACRWRRLELLTVALDLAVPPLSLLVMAWLATITCSLTFGMLTHQWSPAVFAAAIGGLLFAAMLCAWVKYGRQVLPLSAMVKIPSYMLSKIPIYVGFLFQRQRAWTRTERDSPAI